MTGHDERFMRRAIELAGRVASASPNPRVGAVLVQNGRVVAEGFHEGPGSSHAEVAALAGGPAAGGTLYVTLEPCVHHGRTPPCAPRLVASGLARVVVALEDPDPRVSGRGIDHLRSNGVEVTVGVLAEEARRANLAYLHQRGTGRSRLSLKLAMSFDGRLGAPDSTSRWITSAESRRRVHELRRAVDAVMVGAGTVVADDPSLTVRAVQTHRQPVRVIVDSSGRVPPSATVLDTRLAHTIVATTTRAPHETQMAWKEAGAEVLVLPEVAGGVDLQELLARLGSQGLLEVLCEGGARLATSLLRADLVDVLEVHYGAGLIGKHGLSLGDLGASTMSELQRWRCLKAHCCGGDVVTVLERTQEA